MKIPDVDEQKWQLMWKYTDKVLRTCARKIHMWGDSSLLLKGNAAFNTGIIQSAHDLMLLLFQIVRRSAMRSDAYHRRSPHFITNISLLVYYLADLGRKKFDSNNEPSKVDEMINAIKDFAPQTHQMIITMLQRTEDLAFILDNDVVPRLKEFGIEPGCDMGAVVLIMGDEAQRCSKPLREAVAEVISFIEELAKQKANDTKALVNALVVAYKLAVIRGESFTSCSSQILAKAIKTGEISDLGKKEEPQ